MGAWWHIAANQANPLPLSVNLLPLVHYPQSREGKKNRPL